ncbi:TVP38/TMEM64 family protein [Endozoicomonas elysicola]|uniref:TVP38/TMEM64 family protein n=1 Tax=Endozoicomonas elysicola TaxID=305900 RepID=UPI0009D93FE9|nr:VTT domain-containing protein [Endozoicomonas elysicola]
MSTDPKYYCLTPTNAITIVRFMCSDQSFPVNSPFFRNSFLRNPFLRKNRQILSLMGLLSITSIFGSTLVTTLAITWQDTLNSLSTSHWVWLFAISALTMALALTPSTLIALISGYFLGWSAFFYIVISYPIASGIGYMVGKTLDHGKLMSTLPSESRIHRILNELSHQHQWPLVILTRISPILPFSLMNLVLPAIGIRLHTFLLAGFIGMLPRTLFALWAGMQARDLIALLENPTQGNLSVIFMIVVSIISIGGLLYLAQRASSAVLFIRETGEAGIKSRERKKYG